ncbi:MAG: segregation/condensation protein A [Nitrospinae bacterium]|nr:segregation/condensation protein A [Nitrospinota bacterium]
MEYKVKLDIFEGPLALLLLLIKEQKIDIYDIPIALITEQYLEYLELMKTLNLDIVGEFLVMAATLTHIKSKMLLPSHEREDDGEEEGGDPRDELVRRLLEYKKYKEAALGLREKEDYQRGIFTREKGDLPSVDEDDILIEVTIFDLLKAFKRVMKEISFKSYYEISMDGISVSEKQNYIMDRLNDSSSITFDSLFTVMSQRIEVVATFLALLELIRLKVINIQQLRGCGVIRIFKTVYDE